MKKSLSHTHYFQLNSMNKFSLDSLSLYSLASFFAHQLKKKGQCKLHESFFNHAKDITLQPKIKNKVLYVKFNTVYLLGAKI